MCLAIPAKVLNVNNGMSKVDFGSGVLREVNVMLVDVSVGDYVLVHAGYAIQVLDKEEVKTTLELWDKILEMKDE